MIKSENKGWWLEALAVIVIAGTLIALTGSPDNQVKRYLREHHPHATVTKTEGALGSYSYKSTYQTLYLCDGGQVRIIKVSTRREFANVDYDEASSPPQTCK